MKEEKKWYKKISNWLTILICTILVPILLMNLYIIVQSKMNEDEIPSVFGYKPFLVLSGSMETKIHEGDLIITKVIDPSTLMVNDIIAFRDEEDTVTTHRIIDIVEDEGETYFITKGDNNNTQDLNLVSLDDVEGIYMFRIPTLGSLMNSLSDTTTIIVLVMGITIIFIIGFMISNKKQQIKEKEEFLEYKRQKELEEKAKKEQNKKAAKKTTTKKTSKSKKTE